MSPEASDWEQKTAKARHRLILIWTWVGAILLAGVGIYVAGVLSIAIGIIIWTVVFVFILRSPVNWLEKHGVNRTVGTAIAYVLLVAVIGLLLFVVFSPAFGINAQFEELAESIAIDSSELDGLFAKYILSLRKSFEGFVPKHLYDQINQWISCHANGIIAYIIEELISRNIIEKPDEEKVLVNGVFCVEGKLKNF